MKLKKGRNGTQFYLVILKVIRLLGDNPVLLIISPVSHTCVLAHDSHGSTEFNKINRFHGDIIFLVMSK